MNRASTLASLCADADALLAAAPEHLDADVPTCPGWTVERLVGHLGRVYRSMTHWVTQGAAAEDLPRPPAGDAVVAWTRAGCDDLVAVLDAAGGSDDDSAATVATWMGPQPPMFWPRRLAVETAVHRWDAQAAIGEPEPVGTDIALAGVDELFMTILPWKGAAELGEGGESVHLHATDVPESDDGAGEWMVTLGPVGLTVEHAHGKGDVAVRGTASDLLLVLWNRVPLDRCQVFGDVELFERWRAAAQM